MEIFTILFVKLLKIYLFDARNLFNLPHIFQFYQPENSPFNWTKWNCVTEQKLFPTGHVNSPLLLLNALHPNSDNFSSA